MDKTLAPLKPTVPMDLGTYRVLCLFAQGIKPADIAHDLGVGVAAIYSRLKSYPDEYEECKRRLDAAEVARQRIRAAKSNKITDRILDDYEAELNNKTTPVERRHEIMGKLREFAQVAETANERADKIEGRITQRIEHVYSVGGVTIIPPAGAKPMPKTDIVDAEVVRAKYTGQ